MSIFKVLYHTVSVVTVFFFFFFLYVRPVFSFNERPCVSLLKPCPYSVSLSYISLPGVFFFFLFIIQYPLCCISVSGDI